MAILNILKNEDPTLRKTSRVVDAVTPRIQTLLDDMAETMRAAGGVGLAGPQVGILRRVVVIETEESGLLQLVNPEIVHCSERTQEGYEGCLSLPGRWGITVRPMTVTVRALDRNGKPLELTGSGLLAKAFCHEIEHLDGILYTDKAEKMLTQAEMREAGLID